jgi:hypothetical protein
LYRVHNVLVTGAAAEVSVKRVANLAFRRLRIPHEKLMCSKNHSRSAKTALKPMALPKSLLKRMQIFSLRQPFDRRNISAVGLHRKHRAGLHRGIIQHHRARSANTGLAADVRAGQSEDFAKKMNQEQSRFHLVAMLDSIDLDGNSLFGDRVHCVVSDTSKPISQCRAGYQVFVAWEADIR